MPAVARRKHKCPYMGAAPHRTSAWSPKEASEISRCDVLVGDRGRVRQRATTLLTSRTHEISRDRS
jgi:hypothetical protein